MSRTARSPRSRTWLRVLVLLLALWAPVAPAQDRAAPVYGASAGTFEHHGADGLADPPDAVDPPDLVDAADVLDVPVRPATRAVHRADVPERPAPLPGPAPAGGHPCPAGPTAPYAIARRATAPKPERREEETERRPEEGDGCR